MNLLNKIQLAMMGGLSCQAVNDFLCEYVEGTLDQQVQHQFETHLKRCPRCKTYLDQYTQTIELVQEDQDVAVPPTLMEHTLSFLREHIKPQDL